MVDFHPELERAARFIPRTLVTPYTLPLLRGADRLLTRGMGRRAADVEVLTIASGVDVRLHRPPGATGPGPGMVWIHGGGYLIGTPAQDDGICRRFARELGITVAAVDYRLAPEYPYPIPLEDCYSALTWLAGLPAVDPASVVIAGASAGGGLTAALALLARDRGEIDVAAQVLVYPMLDDRSSTAVGIDGSGHKLWTQTSNQYGWASYLGDADPNVAVPSRRDDLGGLAACLARRRHARPVPRRGRRLRRASAGGWRAVPARDRRRRIPWLRRHRAEGTGVTGVRQEPDRLPARDAQADGIGRRLNPSPPTVTDDLSAFCSCGCPSGMALARSSPS